MQHPQNVPLEYTALVEEIMADGPWIDLRSRQLLEAHPTFGPGIFLAGMVLDHWHSANDAPFVRPANEAVAELPNDSWETRHVRFMTSLIGDDPPDAPACAKYLRLNARDLVVLYNLMTGTYGQLPDEDVRNQLGYLAIVASELGNHPFIVGQTSRLLGSGSGFRRAALSFTDQPSHTRATLGNPAHARLHALHGMRMYEAIADSHVILATNNMARELRDNVTHNTFHVVFGQICAGQLARAYTTYKTTTAKIISPADVPMRGFLLAAFDTQGFRVPSGEWAQLMKDAMQTFDEFKQHGTPLGLAGLGIGLSAAARNGVTRAYELLHLLGYEAAGSTRTELLLIAPLIPQLVRPLAKTAGLSPLMSDPPDTDFLITQISRGAEVENQLLLMTLGGMSVAEAAEIAIPDCRPLSPPTATWTTHEI